MIIELGIAAASLYLINRAGKPAAPKPPVAPALPPATSLGAAPSTVNQGSPIHAEGGTPSVGVVATPIMPAVDTSSAVDAQAFIAWLQSGGAGGMVNQAYSPVGGTVGYRTMDTGQGMVETGPGAGTIGVSDAPIPDNTGLATFYRGTGARTPSGVGP